MAHRTRIITRPSIKTVRTVPARVMLCLPPFSSFHRTPLERACLLACPNFAIAERYQTSTARASPPDALLNVIV
jgi:hypothetical protein